MINEERSEFRDKRVTKEKKQLYMYCLSYRDMNSDGMWRPFYMNGASTKAANKGLSEYKFLWGENNAKLEKIALRDRNSHRERE